MPARTTTQSREALRWRAMSALVIAAAAGLGVAGPASQAAAGTTGARSSTAYVVNSGSDTVTPINTATGAPGRPIPVGEGPLAIAVTPDGKTAYVVNSLSDTVTPITTATNTLAGRSRSEVIHPTTTQRDSDHAEREDGLRRQHIGPHRHPDHDRDEHCRSRDPGRPGSVRHRDHAEQQDRLRPQPGLGDPHRHRHRHEHCRASDQCGGRPSAIAITPNGKTAYVTAFSGTVTPIATATNAPGARIPRGSTPAAIAITPDGKTAYVAESTEPGAVTPITIATNTARAPITVGGSPEIIAITPNGKTAYATGETSISPGTMTPIATATNTAGPPVPVGADPVAVAITANGKTAYVVNSFSDTVTPVTTASNMAGTPILVGDRPVAIVITHRRCHRA